MINVTKPFLPPIEEYKKMIEGVWERAWLTNNGPLVNKLEFGLAEYLGIENILYTNNGTIPIQIAIKALGLKGEVLTTPFSYVATTSSLVWENCTPVFVDIEEGTYNINPDLIEDSITDKTTGIVATHVFGNPCAVDKIARIAKKHNLKVIYDAAHCFGTRYKGKSILHYGDVSTLSFHATKLFHTTEGGAAVTTSDDLHFLMDKMRNFGHTGSYSFHCAGINGKCSELHAAMGLAVLNHIDSIMRVRKAQYNQYALKLANTPLKLQKINTKADEYNYAYFPVLFKNEETLMKCVKELTGYYINPRRYFYPSLNTLDYVDYKACPVSESISKRVLCLPLFHDLGEDTIDYICSIIKKSFRSKLVAV